MNSLIGRALFSYRRNRNLLKSVKEQPQICKSRWVRSRDGVTSVLKFHSEEYFSK